MGMKRKSTNGDALVVKRYGNRRLYNTESGGYLTTQDVIDIIRSGRDIQVFDSKSGEDVTKIVLTNIILEEEKLRSNLLPLPFLFQLIRFQGDAMQDFFQNYLSASFEAYLKTKQEFDKRFRGWLEMGAAMNPLWGALPDTTEPDDEEPPRTPRKNSRRGKNDVP